MMIQWSENEVFLQLAQRFVFEDSPAQRYGGILNIPCVSGGVGGEKRRRLFARHRCFSESRGGRFGAFGHCAGACRYWRRRVKKSIGKIKGRRQDACKKSTRGAH